MRSVHGAASRADLAATGTKCEVCCKEFWSTARLKLHLRKHPSCLNVAEAADLDREEIVKSCHPYAWPPAMPVFGPRPFWATRTPTAPQEPVAPAFAALPWPVPPRKDKLCTAVDRTAFAKSVLAFAARTRPGDEDVPLAYLSQDFGVADIARCAVTAARLFLARSAGVATFRRWIVVVQGERAVIRPIQATQVESLPAVWQGFLTP